MSQVAALTSTAGWMQGSYGLIVKKAGQCCTGRSFKETLLYRCIRLADSFRGLRYLTLS